MTDKMTKKLSRSRQDHVLFGLCGGIAAYFGWDSTLVRFATAVLTILGLGSLILIYAVGVFIVPLEPRK